MPSRSTPTRVEKGAPTPFFIAAVLAAGRSSRMGADKLFLPLAGEPILRHVIRAVRGADPDEIWIVTRGDRLERIAALASEERCRVVVNERADEGMGSSIARAAAEVTIPIDGLLLAQGDQPLVPSRTYGRLRSRYRDMHPPFAAARYGELVTTPVIFHPALLAELRELNGDRGARPVLERHASSGVLVEVPEDLGLDVDDPDAYRRVLAIRERLDAERP